MRNNLSKEQAFISNLPADAVIQKIDSNPAGYLVTLKLEVNYYFPLTHIELYNEPELYAHYVGDNMFQNLRKFLSKKSIEYTAKKGLIRRSVESQVSEVFQPELIPCEVPEEVLD